MIAIRIVQVENLLIGYGFRLWPWKHQKFVERVFGEQGVTKEFGRGTLRGLIEYQEEANTLSIVAIQNLIRGNGDFVASIALFEEMARNTGIALRIVQFENTRLAAWFGRRPGWSRHINMELGDHAIFTP